MMYQVKQFIKNTFIFYLLIAIAYWVCIRPFHMNWGATSEEMKMKLPGDKLISLNRIVSTRAISIHAPKEKIWPWVAQTGQNRGGFNSYYWLENLFGAKMINANSVHPEWQNTQKGDTIYYGKNEGYALISSAMLNEYYSISGWTFYLKAIDTGNTRLIIRYPSMEIRQSKFMAVYYYGLFEPLHFIMESGMMMGIKQRAERK